MKKEYLTTSPSQTKKLGEILAKGILRTQLKKRAPKESKHATGQAFVIGLKGDLGGGKTTFLQGFAKGLGIKEKILSPTFIILRGFKIKCLKFKVFYHIDCYRIQKPKEILALSFKEIISDSKNLVAIEWADRIRKILPKDTLILKFQFVNKNKRKIAINSDI